MRRLARADTSYLKRLSRNVIAPLSKSRGGVVNSDNPRWPELLADLAGRRACVSHGRRHAGASAAEGAAQEHAGPCTCVSAASVWNPFCLCLCLGSLVHVTRTTPLRFTILQWRHIFLTDWRTFIAAAGLKLVW